MNQDKHFRRDPIPFRLGQPWAPNVYTFTCATCGAACTTTARNAKRCPGCAKLAEKARLAKRRRQKGVPALQHAPKTSTL